MDQHERGRGLKSSYEWLEFAARQPARIVAYTGQSAPFVGFSGRCIAQGLFVNNGNAAGQTIILADGLDTTGPDFHQAFIGNGANQTINFGINGVLCETGIWVGLFGGPWKITLYVVPLWHYPFTPPGE